jgi:hypothetical protein
MFGSGKDNDMTPSGLLSMTYATTSRSGKFFGGRHADGKINRFHYGNAVTVLPGEDKPKKGERDKFWIIDETINYTHFQQDESTKNYLFGETYGIDDLVPDGGRFISSTGGGRVAAGIPSLTIFNWKTGKFLYDIPMPLAVVNIALEDKARCYCLLNNRAIILVDYLRGEILGAAKIPPLKLGMAYGGDSGLDMIFDEVRIAWDGDHRRLLLIEKTPNDAAGACTMLVRGYLPVPEPVRVTTPIPLRVPRPGRTIPLHVQVVDDMNQGIGGYVVDCTVTGEGKLVGQPITNHLGHAIISVECDPAAQVVY